MHARLPKRMLTVVAVLLIAVSLLLSLRTVKKRVVWVNLNMVFPTLSDTYKSGTQLKTFPYPCSGGHSYYYIRTTNGSVRIEIELSDYSRVPYFRQYKVGSPSQPIGEESFYEIAHPSHSEDLMDLVYQRHNVTAFFRQEPIHGLPGKAYAYSDQDRQQVEQLARTLDDAIERGGAGVTVENVHGYEVLFHAIRSFIASSGAYAFLFGRSSRACLARTYTFELSPVTKPKTNQPLQATPGFAFLYFDVSAYESSAASFRE